MNALLEALAGVIRNPLVAIFLGIGAMVFIIKLGEAFSGEHRRKRAVQPAPLEIEPLRAEIESLREEMKLLRDTTTQHAMSLDRNVELLNQRVTDLDGRVQTGEQVRQRLGQGP